VLVHKKHETERETDIYSPLYEKANTTVSLLCHTVSKEIWTGVDLVQGLADVKSTAPTLSVR
jgi:hypothetical protein